MENRTLMLYFHDFDNIITVSSLHNDYTLTLHYIQQAYALEIKG